MQKWNNYTHTFDLCWTFSILHCSSWYFSLALIPSPAGPLRTSSCVALLSPLHFYLALILSLTHFLSVLSSFSLSPQLSSTTGLWNSFQVLICISQRSPPFCLLFCVPLSLSSWLASLSICALVCALQLFIHIWTETHPDFYFSAICSIHSLKHPAKDILSLSFPHSVSLWLRVCVHIYSQWFHSLVL